MKGKIECEKPWSCFEDIDFSNIPDNSEIKDSLEWFSLVTSKDPEFVLEAFRKLWSYSLKACKNTTETWDDVSKEIGLTSDEFNFCMCMD